MSFTSLCVKCRSAFVDESSETPPSINTVRSQLRSGYHLSKGDITQLFTLMEQTERDMERIGAKITVLEEMKKRLEVQRKVLEKHVDECRGLLSPIRQLPVEILEIFFSHYCSGSPSLIVGSRGIENIGPLVLSSVCKLWRDTSLNRTSLWSRIDVNLAAIKKQRITELIRLYLERSSPSPLTLNISWVVDTNSERRRRGRTTKQQGQLTLSLLSILETASRWQSVSFGFTSGLIWNVIPKKHDSVRFDALRDLDLLESSFTSDGDFVDFFLSTPSLQSLKLSEFCLKYPFPFSQLKALTILDPFAVGSRDICHVFTACPALEELVLEPTYIGLDLTILSPFPQITHPNLRALTLRMRRCDSLLTLVSSLTVPNLKSLTLMGDIPASQVMDDPKWRIWKESLKAMLLRSSCRLENLTMGAAAVKADKDLLEILALVPTVTHLILIHFHFVSNHFLRALTLDHSSSTSLDTAILPNLTHLDLTVFLHDGVNRCPQPDQEILFSMIKSRCRGSHLRDFGLAARVAHGDASAESWVQVFISRVKLRLDELEEVGLRWALDLPLTDRNRSIYNSVALCIES
ncbi:hypothetical protein D9758_004179 [Tetrapyrgos nigripes]|uniref:F-box domain-containing protein n=1 Tax=Tetrapyrgos nigripes TaxID=182062 RepID=A0A8H5GUQ3_9AGAR|nr:hypothetical protein D9758_004179 [Tetrapyrgos nigripes]